ncbi:hypothetical protein OLMES_2577 [Oleiphilus messinensis]|uniref:Uncharacterized protein n=1 Tax=Oleiphilus messinensis TaxID=141451 RepID=A0A1Y0I7Z4_9GAMM|nr:hypothetical protein [Oleiphilus messinensis]ARU56627.1 hypothetical protein OLMES_2577 [Oleiphilus messinensis]
MKHSSLKWIARVALYIALTLPATLSANTVTTVILFSNHTNDTLNEAKSFELLADLLAADYKTESQKGQQENSLEAQVSRFLSTHGEIPTDALVIISTSTASILHSTEEFKTNNLTNKTTLKTNATDVIKQLQRLTKRGAKQVILVNASDPVDSTQTTTKVRSNKVNVQTKIFNQILKSKLKQAKLDDQHLDHVSYFDKFTLTKAITSETGNGEWNANSGHSALSHRKIEYLAIAMLDSLKFKE